MSVATEISRIQGAKADLKTSIETKGVTVPSATLISGYASLVDQIQTGGGVPDSDGLVALAIANGDMTGSASTLTLTYTPTYMLRYSPSSPLSNVQSMAISKTVTYPPVVWSCDSASISISGSTATIPTGTNADVTFTATWTDCNADTQTTSKAIHLMNLAYAMITINTSTDAWSKYFVTDTWPDNIGISSYEEYKSVYICTGEAQPPSWGEYTVLSNDGTTAAIFNSSDEAKAAIDTM